MSITCFASAPKCVSAGIFCALDAAGSLIALAPDPPTPPPSVCLYLQCSGRKQTDRAYMTRILLSFPFPLRFLAGYFCDLVIDVA